MKLINTIRYMKTITRRIFTKLKDVILSWFAFCRKGYFAIKNKIDKFTLCIYRASTKKFILSFVNLSRKKLFVALLINFIVGFGILYFTETMNIFLIHLVCLSINIYLTYSFFVNYIKALEQIEASTIKIFGSQYSEINGLLKNFQLRIFKKVNLLPGVIVLILFFWGIFNQQYITLNLVGFYAIFLVIISVFLSTYGYILYLRLLWFIFRIDKLKTTYFLEYNPSKTPILIYLADLCAEIKTRFFIEGLIYVFQYFILIPISPLATTDMMISPSFIVTWIVLLIVIVLAFPILVLVQEKLLTDVVRKTKLSTTENTMIILSKPNLSNNQRLMYNSLISILVNSDDYPISNKRVKTLLAPFATATLHVITLLSQIPALQESFSLFKLS